MMVHVVMNDKTHELLALIVQKDMEREEREVQIRKEIQEFCTTILNISEQRSSRRSTRRKPTRTPITERVSESKCKPKTESKEEPPPVKKNKKKARLVKKANRTESMKPFEEGNKYEAGMDWDVS